MTKVTKNRNLANLRRLSGSATRKLRTVIRFSATAIRDKILDEALNKHAERFDVDAEHDAMAFEAAGALNAAREIAVQLGAAYRGAYIAGFSLADWYQACGLDEKGELYDGLFDDGTEADKGRYPDQESVRALLGAAQNLRSSVLRNPSDRTGADYAFPERIVLDKESFAKFSAEMANPGPPNDALRELFKKPRKPRKRT